MLCGSGFARRALAQGGLGGRKARDRHPEWRARHVIERDLVAEGDRRRVAAVLAADADLEPIARLAPALDPDPHQLADAFAVDRHERVGVDDAARGVMAEKACRVVAAD